MLFISAPIYHTHVIPVNIYSVFKWLTMSDCQSLEKNKNIVSYLKHIKLADITYMCVINDCKDGCGSDWAGFAYFS
jgi:hypothetical protein